MKYKSGKRWAFVALFTSPSMMMGDPQCTNDHYTKKEAINYRAYLRKNGAKCGKVFCIPSQDLT
jgi:hypothetical protein